MANINILSPFILSWEGGFVNDPHDRGGATNRGVTIATWRQVGYDKDGDGDIDVDDLKLITAADAVDRVKSQSVANIVVDWVWASGRHGITQVQQLLGVKADGIVGENTLAAINAQDPRQLFDRIKAARVAFIEGIVARNPSQRRFRKGWLTRLDYIKFGSLTHNSRTPQTLYFNDR